MENKVSFLEANTNLQPYNTLRLPAQARYFIRLRDRAMLSKLREIDPHLSRRILGSGSNLVLPEYINALVIKMELAGRRLVSEDHKAWYVSAAAGENWHQFVMWTLQQGWSGLENLALIPGTVGAVPVQNVGAYGVEVEERFFELTAWNLKTEQLKCFTRAACQFGYRDSLFKREEAADWLITDVIFRLPKKPILRTSYGEIDQLLAESGSVPTPKAIANAIIQIRTSKLPDPLNVPNVGSFFKNPLVNAQTRDHLMHNWSKLVSYPQAHAQWKLAAGWLIEQAGWKGKSLGSAGVYEKQALILVNHGGATCKDILALAQAVRTDVQKQFGITLEQEPICW